jgi:hypothetical protein
MALIASCRHPDPQVPWDTEQMARQLTAGLRHVEGQTQDSTQFEVLAWTIAARRETRDRVEIALLWRRTGPAGAPTGWTLEQAFRNPDADTRWQPSVIYRELKSPLIRVRPGEDADGTWHAIQGYAHPPTSREVCEFAEVDFAREPPTPWIRLSGGVRTQTWLRVVGELPGCDLGIR